MNDEERKRLLSEMVREVDPELKTEGVQESLEAATESPAAGEGFELEVMRSSAPGPGEAEMVQESLDVLREGRELDDDHVHVLEAIVMPFKRPVVDVIQGSMVTRQLQSTWRHLGETWKRGAVEGTFRSIGCIELPGHPKLPYAGTGFIVGRGPAGGYLLMTNRHVAELFSTGVGVGDQLRLNTDLPVRVDYLRELSREEADEFRVIGVLMVHPYWDMALVEVEALDGEEREVLGLSTRDPSSLREDELVTIGYPGYDPFGDTRYQQTQQRIFRGVYFVKRLAPGTLKPEATEAVDTVYGHKVEAMIHNCSTLGGNSGSAVLVLPRNEGDKPEVAGLHFAGAYLHANYAVPARSLAEDPRVVDAGVSFAQAPPAPEPKPEVYDEYWNNIGSLPETPSRRRNVLQPVGPGMARPQSIAPIAGARSTWTIPLNITVSVGDPSQVTATPVPHSAAPSAEGLFGAPPVPIEEQLPLFDIESLSATDFSWKTALSLAVASKLAYSEKLLVEELAVDALGFDDCEFIAADSTECFWAANSDAVLVSFRGTTDVADWLTDLNLASTRQPYGVVHRGFFFGFEVVREQLETKLGGVAGKRLFFAGHSLGGALATIAAAAWSVNFQGAAVYTYGQPAVGRDGLQATIHGGYNGRFHRFVNDDDIITRVPPHFRHVGLEYHFDSVGRLTPSLSSESPAATSITDTTTMSREAFDKLRADLLNTRARRSHNVVSAESLAVAEGLLPSISDHRIDAYIALLRAL